MKKVYSVILALVFTVSMALPCAAQEYSREYPDIYNSGSPLWIHCNIKDYGDYVLLIDPETPLEAFGFDAPTGYNLINNTASTVNGRAYDTNSTLMYTCRWQSYYCLQFRVATSMGGYVWEDVYINNIYGTTMNLVDYVGDRGNDYYDGLDVDYRQLLLVIIAAGLVIALLNYFIFKRGHR